jgi:uncharacterized membrane protein YecN with MAPEG domain
MLSSSMSVTLLYTGLNALILLTLAILTVRARVQTRTDIGTGDNVAMIKAVRAHGNAAEYVPVALILIGTLELAGAARPLLHGLGIALTAARLAHAQGIYASLGNSPGRLIGTLLTWVVYLVGGGACLYYAVAA